MATNDGTDGWVALPLDIAKQHPLYGVGGWLILVAIGTVVTPIRIAIGLVPLYTTIDYATLHPNLFAFILAEIALNAVFILWSLTNLLLLLSKHRWFPRSFAAAIAFSVIFITLDAVASKFIMDSIEQPMPWDKVFDPETLREAVRSVVAAAIWIPYSFVSRRVNVTYLNRVRGDDPLLLQSVARVF
jgi:hypothetical protein